MRNLTANKTVRAAAVLVGLLGLMTMSASAMHIAEGMLPVPWAIGWGAVCVPFLVAGFFSIKKKIDQAPRAKILLAMCGAFAFVLSALKIPSVSGSCSHPTGVGLGAILFGPLVMTVLGLIVLLFQALLLAHGGLTTLGANTFSMASAGPIVSWLVYKLLRKAKAPAAVAVFAAAALGDLFTYVVTSVQLPTGDENDWLGLARNVLKTLEEEYSDIVLVSHSMGTLLSVLLSSNEKVSMQFLIAPAFSTSFGICDEELEKLGTEDYERSIPWKSDDSYHLSYPGAPRDDEVLGREYWSHFYASDALAFTRLKKMALDVLESVTIPTYVYHGLKDETAPSDGLVETFSKVKGRVRIKIFDEGTHLLMYDRCRDVEKELIASIASVLDGRPAL